MEKQTLCQTCRYNVLVRATVAGKKTESRGCWHHIVSFPTATNSRFYEREPGVD